MAKSGRDETASRPSSALRVGEIEQRRRRGRQMPAGGKAHDADAIGLHAEFRRARSHQTNRPQHVLQRRRVPIARPQPVLHDRRRHAVRGEPARHLMAFVIHGQRAIAAAGADHDERARRLGFGRLIERDGRLVQIVGAHRAGRAVGPQQFGLRRVDGAKVVLGGGGGGRATREREDHRARCAWRGGYYTADCRLRIAIADSWIARFEGRRMA